MHLSPLVPAPGATQVAHDGPHHTPVRVRSRRGRGQVSFAGICCCGCCGCCGFLLLDLLLLGVLVGAAQHALPSKVCQRKQAQHAGGQQRTQARPQIFPPRKRVLPSKHTHAGVQQGGQYSSQADGQQLGGCCVDLEAICPLVYRGEGVYPCMQRGDALSPHMPRRSMARMLSQALASLVSAHAWQRGKEAADASSSISFKPRWLI